MVQLSSSQGLSSGGVRPTSRWPPSAPGRHSSLCGCPTSHWGAGRCRMHLSCRARRSRSWGPAPGKPRHSAVATRAPRPPCCATIPKICRATHPCATLHLLGAAMASVAPAAAGALADAAAALPAAAALATLAFAAAGALRAVAASTPAAAPAAQALEMATAGSATTLRAISNYLYRYPLSRSTPASFPTPIS